jgi:ABC-type nitrate/sulfonate/bicarbonate transport system permease component
VKRDAPVRRTRLVGSPGRPLVLAVARLAVIAVALGGWQLAAEGGGNPYFLPPSAVFPAMYRQWFDGPAGHLWLTADATANLLPSLGRMLAGLAIASVIAIVLGVAIGRSALVSDLVEPVVHFARAVPPPILVPVFLFVLGIGTPMEIWAIVFGVLWPVLVNAIDGARDVHPGHLETARAFKVPAAQRLAMIILPSAAPKIFAGLRLGVALALVMMVVSEFVGSINGVGGELVAAQGSGRISVMWAVIVVLGLLGVILNLLLATAERWVLAWQQPGSGVS